MQLFRVYMYGFDYYLQDTFMSYNEAKKAGKATGFGFRIDTIERSQDSGDSGDSGD